MTSERIPLAKPVLGEREEELVLEVLRSGRLSLGPMQERFERAFADYLGRPRRGRGVLGHGGASPRGPGARLGRGRRGRHLAVLLRRLGQLPALRGRDAGLLRRRPDHPQPRSRRRPGRRSASGPRACCRSTSSATRPRCRSSRRSPPRAASGCSRTPARRSAPVTPRAGWSARAATSPPSPSTPTSS